MTHGYVADQLGRALETASAHEDRATRQRADRRAAAWIRVLEGMRSGDVVVGSRTPVDGLPAWVTLEVVRGGFATGRAVAEGALAPDELALARRLGVPADRRYLFGYYLTDPGLDELNEMLDSGCYRIGVPEDAALLTLAWLVRAGDRTGAMDLLDAISPLASRLRFAPKTSPAPAAAPGQVFRTSAGDAVSALRRRKEPPAVAAQREVLTIWNPLSDRVLELWLDRVDQATDEIAVTGADETWTSRAAAIVAEYDRLASAHTRTTRHRRPKENLAIQIRALRSVVDGEVIDRRALGLLRHSVTSAVAKRGLPGSPRHTALRARQRAEAVAPAHHLVAGVVADRLAELDPDNGVAEPETLLDPIGRVESRTHGVPAGVPFPPAVPRVVARTRLAPVERLVDEGVVPSSEVLAELIPQLTAEAIASSFGDPSLARLVAAHYRAFRRRRSLLLLDLEKQVQVRELPWAAALDRHTSDRTDEAAKVLRRVGELALVSFPGTILPNPLVQELAQLARASGSDAVFVEELAADIFTGAFSDKFRRAAVQAAGVLRGTLYERYYGIDYDEVRNLPAPGVTSRPWPGLRRRVPDEVAPNFADLCFLRAGVTGGTWGDTAENGTVIEQAQILTSHNLAPLVELGVAPRDGWAKLAGPAVRRVTELLALAAQQERPHRSVKDAAFAWRQALFFLSMAGRSSARRALGDLLDGSTETAPASTRALLRDAMRALDANEEVPAGWGRPFVGWTTTRHWILGPVPLRGGHL